MDEMTEDMIMHMLIYTSSHFQYKHRQGRIQRGRVVMKVPNYTPYKEIIPFGNTYFFKPPFDLVPLPILSNKDYT